jgi:histidinol-phosphatase
MPSVRMQCATTTLDSPVAEKGDEMQERSMMRQDLGTYLDFALQLADVAEQEILKRHSSFHVSHKPDGSEVTEADREAERAMRALLAVSYPEHGVWGEEFGKTDTPSAYQWVLDPVDGTTWFTLGVPTFGTLIALLERNEPVVGVIHLPVSGETVYAAKGCGCWYKTREQSPIRVQVEPPRKLEEAIVSASGVHATGIQPIADHATYNLTRLIRRAGKFRFCGDCIQHALVSRGRIHAAVDTIMQPWDNAAIIPCI